MSTETQLVNEIEDAFPISPVPGPSEILYNEEPGYTGSFPVDSELEEIKACFGNRSWRSITPQELGKIRHAIFYLSSRAFAYFLPAWMVCCLRDAQTMDTGSDDVFSTLPEKSPDIWNEHQRRVICAWLEHFKPCVGDLTPKGQNNFRQAIERLGCGVLTRDRN